jgi:glycosyltransferase involved in cell wall biosynthesis
MESNQLTIVIPCKNEGSSIVDVLELLKIHQPKIKIIVADSSDDIDSIQILENFSKKNKNIKIIDGGLPSVARNKGSKLVKTEYVLFLDADVYIQNNIIQKSLMIIIGGNYELVTAKFRTNDGKFNWVYKIFDIIQFLTSKTKPFALGGFMLFKTETFRMLGGFNEEDKIAEDYHLSSKVTPNKFKIVDDYVFTTSRRFQNKGVWYMLKIMIKCWLNRNNELFYKQDYNYWNNEKKN